MPYRPPYPLAMATKGRHVTNSTLGRLFRARGLVPTLVKEGVLNGLQFANSRAPVDHCKKQNNLRLRFVPYLTPR
jgi:hypothetical protein